MAQQHNVADITFGAVVPTSSGTPVSNIFAYTPPQTTGTQVWCAETQVPISAEVVGGHTTTAYSLRTDCSTVYKTQPPSILLPSTVVTIDRYGDVTTSYYLSANPDYVTPPPPGALRSTSSSSWNPATEVNTWTAAPTPTVNTSPATVLSVPGAPQLLVPVTVACLTALLFLRRAAG